MIDYLDDDGYPTDAALQIVENWSHEKLVGLFDFIRDLWQFKEWGWNETDAAPDAEGAGKHYEISTGGWSGNESLISALMGNTMAWHLSWVQSRRGGHYVFEVRGL